MTDAQKVDAVDVLRELEWSDLVVRLTGPTIRRCPSCRGLDPRTRYEKEVGHTTDCRLAAALRNAQPDDVAEVDERAAVAYQIVGSLASDLGQFEHPAVIKALDYLAGYEGAPYPLPFPSFESAPSGAQPQTVDAGAVAALCEALAPFADADEQCEDDEDHQLVWPTLTVGDLRKARAALQRASDARAAGRPGTVTDSLRHAIQRWLFDDKISAEERVSILKHHPSVRALIAAQPATEGAEHALDAERDALAERARGTA